MSHILEKFPNQPAPPYVSRAEGAYIFTEDGRKLLDVTAGSCSHAILGFTHPEVLSAMEAQMKRFTHMDYNSWRTHELDELSELLLSQAPEGLDKVYFAGCSGSESVEAAIKLSYQSHYDAGNPEKTWLISRQQGFHGSTLQSLAVSEKDIFEFFNPLLPVNRARIPQHHPLREMRPGESLDDYARRSAKDLEDKILEIGADKVCAFIGETIMGGLVGDVPPAPGYWKYVREVCDRHDVHLILDEVYCGLGRSGKIYCCSWDDVTPDFLCLGKTLAAGYVPLNAVLTKSRFLDIIAAGQGRVQIGHTFQGFSLGVAAALAVQKVVHRPETLDHINALGTRMRQRLDAGLGNHPYFREIRGRGSLFSLEYECPRMPKFGETLFQTLENKHDILISAKWHRISFSPPYILKFDEADRVVDAVIRVFKETADGWED
jgi:adenosylmethionine-8-amino-7-oxononanoate aminotransferase